MGLSTSKSDFSQTTHEINRGVTFGVTDLPDSSKKEARQLSALFLKPDLAAAALHQLHNPRLCPLRLSANKLISQRYQQ